MLIHIRTLLYVQLYVHMHLFMWFYLLDVKYVFIETLCDVIHIKKQLREREFSTGCEPLDF